jgi:hypothetical protein
MLQMMTFVYVNFLPTTCSSFQHREIRGAKPVTCIIVQERRNDVNAKAFRSAGSLVTIA